MFIINSYSLAIILLCDHHAVLGIMGKYIKTVPRELALSIVLLGLLYRTRFNFPHPGTDHGKYR